jgi:hypothetical protein
MTHLLPATNTRLTGPALAAAYRANWSQGESASGEGGPKNVGPTAAAAAPGTAVLLLLLLLMAVPVPAADCCCCCSCWHSSRGRVCPGRGEMGSMDV